MKRVFSLKRKEIVLYATILILLSLTASLAYLYAESRLQLANLQSGAGTWSLKYPFSGGNSLTPTQIFKIYERSVVSIDTKKRSSIGLVPYNLGSGFVYDNLGNIITNNHVVEGSDVIRVTFNDGTVAKAKLVGRDPYSDLAVIRVDVPAEQLEPVLFEDSTNLVVGEPVVVIGNPFGLGNSMSAGIISQLGREISSASGYLIVDIIQVDAAINPGNSGGPLINGRGRVIGVNTAIYTESGTFSGIGLAVPSSTVKRAVPSLIQTGKYLHPWMGISGAAVSPEIAEEMKLGSARGVLVTSVVNGSPAEKAGIRAGNRKTTIEGQEITLGGDVIVKIDNWPVRKVQDILVYLERYKSVGDFVTFTMLRDGQTVEVDLQLGERPR